MFLLILRIKVLIFKFVGIYVFVEKLFFYIKYIYVIIKEDVFIFYF